MRFTIDKKMRIFSTHHEQIKCILQLVKLTMTEIYSKMSDDDIYDMSTYIKAE